MSVFENISFFTSKISEVSMNYNKVHDKLKYGYSDDLLFDHGKGIHSFRKFVCCTIHCSERDCTTKFMIGSHVYPLCVITKVKHTIPEYSYIDDNRLIRSLGTSNDTVLQLRDVDGIPLVRIPQSLEEDIINPWEFQMLTKYDVDTFNILLLDAWLVNTFSEIGINIEVNFEPFISMSSEQRLDITELFICTLQSMKHEASIFR